MNVDLVAYAERFTSVMRAASALLSFERSVSRLAKRRSGDLSRWAIELARTLKTP